MRKTELTITCDICNKEIKPEIDNSLALLDIRKLVSKLNIIQQPSNGTLKEFSQLSTKQDIINIQIDICESCLKKVEDFLETIKN